MARRRFAVRAAVAGMAMAAVAVVGTAAPASALERPALPDGCAWAMSNPYGIAGFCLLDDGYYWFGWNGEWGWFYDPVPLF